MTKPKLLILDEPTEGIQPSIIKDIGRALVHLRRKGDMAILVVEQYFEWARDIADDYAVMDRGAIVLSGTRAEMDEERGAWPDDGVSRHREERRWAQGVERRPSFDGLWRRGDPGATACALHPLDRFAHARDDAKCRSRCRLCPAH